MAKYNMNQKTNKTVQSGGTATLQSKVKNVKGSAESKGQAHSPKVNLSRPSITLTHEQIAERAWFIWQQRGCRSGEDEWNWLEAETQLKEELGID